VGLTLAKNLSGWLREGEWRRTDAGTAIRCPLCGKVHRLNPETHVVARDGRVTPAFACHACPFLDWLTLGGWGDE
jgi:hypothetical protein